MGKERHKESSRSAVQVENVLSLARISQHLLWVISSRHTWMLFVVVVLFLCAYPLHKRFQLPRWITLILFLEGEKTANRNLIKGKQGVIIFPSLFLEFVSSFLVRRCPLLPASVTYQWPQGPGILQPLEFVQFFKWIPKTYLFLQTKARHINCINCQTCLPLCFCKCNICGTRYIVYLSLCCYVVKWQNSTIE